jgi:hypothetical protein
MAEYLWHKARATAGLDADGKVANWYGTSTDINDKKIAEAKLSHNALHDALTNLPNRIKFMNHLERAVSRSECNPAFKFAVLFLDLDRFKIINDSLGHSYRRQIADFDCRTTRILRSSGRYCGAFGRRRIYCFIKQHQRIGGRRSRRQPTARKIVLRPIISTPTKFSRPPASALSFRTKIAASRKIFCATRTRRCIGRRSRQIAL